jgi:hypothetical protein
VKKIKILLTFDYELPLGFAEDYDAGLFVPGQRLLDKARAVDVPVVLFADVCSAIRFESWDKAGFYDPFVRQLQAYLANKHDVQLHIHPHWMTSSMTDGVFKPSSDYSLSQFRMEKQGFTIETIIEAAYRKLVAICSDGNPGYRCVAYRAGGYDVEPASARILRKLHDLGVMIDSSVIKDYFLDFSYSHVDYSGSPDSSAWFVSVDGPLTRAVHSGILELPITSKPASVLDIANRRLRKWTQRSALASRVYHNKGKGFASLHGGERSTAPIRKMFNPIVLSLDKEYLEVSDLEDIVQYNVTKYAAEEGDLILTLIGHPKSMGTYHLQLMEGFLGRMRKNYGSQVSFITYKDIQLSPQHAEMD